MKKVKEIKNVFFSTYNYFDTLTEWDKKLCEENNEPYEPSALTLTVLGYVDEKGYLSTDFETLKTIAKIIDECWGFSLIISPSGNIVIFNGNY